MTLFNILPLLALLPVVLIALSTLGPSSPPRKMAWALTAIFCAVFTVWTIIAVLQEGLLGFWPNHSQDFWGNQVWFDLLMAFTMTWVLIVPRAKAQGMKLPFWLIFTLCSGSIGLSAMLARLLFLERAKN